MNAFWAGFEKQAVSAGAYARAIQNRMAKAMTPSSAKKFRSRVDNAVANGSPEDWEKMPALKYLKREGAPFHANRAANAAIKGKKNLGPSKLVERMENAGEKYMKGRFPVRAQR